MTTSRKKRRIGAATTSGTNATSVLGTNAKSVSAITITGVAVTGNAMMDMAIGGDPAVNKATKNDDMTTINGTNAKSIRGIDAGSVPTTTNTVVTASDAMTNVIIGGNTMMDFAICGDAAVNKATKNDDMMMTSDESIRGSNARSVPTTINTVVVARNAMTNVIIGGDTITNAESIPGNDARAIPTVTNTIIATSNVITDVIIGDGTTTGVVTATNNAESATTNSVTNAVVADKTAGIEGAVDALVQVSVRVCTFFLYSSLLF
jgi:hypothetical protein